MNHEPTNPGDRGAPRHRAVWELVADQCQAIDAVGGIYVYQR